MDSYYVTSSSSEGLLVGIMAFVASNSIFSVLVSILIIIAMWVLFKKHGKPGWAAIVPIYNVIVLCEIADKPWWYLFLLMIPFVNIYFFYVIYNAIAKKHDKGTGFTIGLLLLPVIFIPILAFSKYDGEIESSNMQSTPVTNTIQNATSDINNVVSNNQISDSVGMPIDQFQQTPVAPVEMPVNEVPTFETPVNNQIQNAFQTESEVTKTSETLNDVPTFNTKPAEALTFDNTVAPSPAFTEPQSPVMLAQQAPVAGPTVSDEVNTQNINSSDNTNTNFQ